jgi:hypothetical protein
VFGKVKEMRSIATRIGLLVGLCLLPAPAALAQTPGLHVDPNSPTGKEYAIPLDHARNSASGGGSQAQPSNSGGSDSSSPLFGVGVGGGGGSGNGGSGGSGGSGSGGAKPGAKPGSKSGARSTPLLPTGIREASASPSAGVGTPLMVAGIAAAVVLAGALFGLILRRRRVADPGS